jgi:hypothetical protein
MNRRNFLRSGAIFGVGLSLAPSLAGSVIPPPQTTTASTAVPDYGPGCPGFAALLADLIVGFLNVFPDAYLTPDSADYQFLSVIALQQCDMFCQMDVLYRSFTPVAATGAELDKLVGLNRDSRRFIEGRAPKYSAFGTGREVPNETDEELRKRLK